MWVCSKKAVEQLGIRCNLDRMFISPFSWWVGTYKSLESLTRCLQLHLSGFSLETHQPLHALPLRRALPETAKETWRESTVYLHCSLPNRSMCVWPLVCVPCVFVDAVTVYTMCWFGCDQLPYRDEALDERLKLMQEVVTSLRGMKADYLPNSAKPEGEQNAHMDISCACTCTHHVIELVWSLRNMSAFHECKIKLSNLVSITFVYPLPLLSSVPGVQDR